MFTFDRLRVLRAIEVAGSVTGAARTLSVTASAVSQQLARLERDVGQQLVERQGRGGRGPPSDSATTRACLPSRNTAAWVVSSSSHEHSCPIKQVGHSHSHGSPVRHMRAPWRGREGATVPTLPTSRDRELPREPRRSSSEAGMNSFRSDVSTHR